MITPAMASIRSSQEAWSRSIEAEMFMIKLCSVSNVKMNYFKVGHHVPPNYVNFVADIDGSQATLYDTKHAPIFYNQVGNAPKVKKVELWYDVQDDRKL